MAPPRNVFISPLLLDRMGRRFFSCLRFVNQILMSPGQVDFLFLGYLAASQPFLPFGQALFSSSAWGLVSFYATLSNFTVVGNQRKGSSEAAAGLKK